MTSGERRGKVSAAADDPIGMLFTGSLSLDGLYTTGGFGGGGGGEGREM